MRSDRSPDRPEPGDVVIVGAAASVQFAGGRGFLFRVIRVDGQRTYRGWVWLAGFVINRDGVALEKREIFVQRAGLRWGLLGPKVPRRRRQGET
nr:hypothetical protein [Micromonospora sp. DSM 115978]